jgi:hypothetical protein
MAAARGSSELMQSKSVYKSGAYRGVSHQNACISEKNRVERSVCWQHMHMKTKECIWLLATYTSKATPANFKDLCLEHTEGVHVPRLLVTRLHRLYVSLAVRREYSSPGHSGSTSTSPCIPTTRLPAAAALHRLRRTPPRHRLLGVRLPRLLTSTSLNQKTSRGRLSRHQQLVRIHLQLVDFSSNRRGSITDRHGFVDTRPRIKLSHLFQ